MKNLLIILLSAFFILGCTHYFTKVNYPQNQFLLNPNSITIDSSYSYYIRKVYKREGPFSKKSFVSNLYEGGKPEDLVEIEYLLLSPSKGNAIYLTMIQDMNQKFYSRNYLGDQYINGFEFRNFLFGTFKHNKIVFISKDDSTTDEWTVGFNDTADEVLVLNILENVHGEYNQNTPIEKALDKNVGFTKISTPSLVFHYPGKPLSDIYPSADNKIHFYKPINKIRIHFVFKKESTENLNIYYKYKRAPYSYDSLLD